MIGRVTFNIGSRHRSHQLVNCWELLSLSTNTIEFLKIVETMPFPVIRGHVFVE